MDEVLDQLATIKQFITGSETHDFPFVAGKASYTLGPNADWELEEPPERIDLWSVVAEAGQQGEHEYARRQLDSEREWRGIVAKRRPATYPYRAYAPGKYDDAGRLTIHFSPVPDSPTYKARLYIHQPSITRIDPSRTYTLPRGYAGGLRAMLAVRLMRAQQREPSPELAREARDGLKLIKRQNRRFPASPIDVSFISDRHIARSFGIRGFGR